jgi:predicted DNA-binding antitoxin AbrB/MazE fold protein
MQAIQATYENGVFTPLQPVELPNGSQVTLWIERADAEVAHLRPEDRAFLDELVVRRAEVFRRLAE